MFDKAETAASEELDLISSSGRWNPRVKGYLIAAHQHYMGKSPQEIAVIYENRGKGVTQDEFFVPFQMTIRKFPLTFERFLVLGPGVKKSYALAQKEFSNYLYNRLYYAYYHRSPKINGKTPNRFMISKEHPLHHGLTSALRKWYEFYVSEFSSINSNNLEEQLKDLKNCMAMMQSFSHVMQHVITRASDLLSSSALHAKLSGD